VLTSEDRLTLILKRRSDSRFAREERPAKLKIGRKYIVEDIIPNEEPRFFDKFKACLLELKHRQNESTDNGELQVYPR
jgi:hypothetical protein